MLRIDLTGKKFNRLSVLEFSHTTNGRLYWKCKCDCGNMTLVSSGNLKSGTVKSCGCLSKETSTRTHGLSKTKEYRIWSAMLSRCRNPNNPAYKNYGARGITVCDEWVNSAETFISWLRNNGYSSELSVDRIDNDKGYSPENCRIVNKKEQANNRRRCRVFEYNGESKNLMQWSEELGLDYKMLHNRIKKLGWSFEKAISEPIDIKKRNMKYRK